MAQVTDKAIADKVDRLGELAEQIARLQNELNKMKKEAKGLEDDLRPLLDEMDEASDRILETKNSAVRIVKVGFERRSKQYAAAFDLALTKVNEATKNILTAALESTTKISYVNSKLAATRVEESIGSALKNVLKKFSSWVRKQISKIKKSNKDLKKASSAIAKLEKLK